MNARPTCKTVARLTGNACGKPASVLIDKTPLCAECALIHYLPREAPYDRAQPNRLGEFAH
jgi:hypothetical protein